VFPGWDICGSSWDTHSAGVLTLISPQIQKDYIVQHSIVVQGYVLRTTLTHKVTHKQLNYFNCYFHASDPTIWIKQVKTVTALAPLPNSFLAGDINFVDLTADRSGPCSVNPAQVATFDSLLTAFSLQEIYQPHHTRYGINANKAFTSARLDRAYHNLDFASLAIAQPSVKVITTAPWSIANNGIKGHKPDKCLLIDNVTTLENGGCHLSDHLPISVRFTSVFNKNRTKSISASSLQSPNFAPTFHSLWKARNTSTGCWNARAMIKELLFETSCLVDHSSSPPDDRRAVLRAGIRLLKAIEDSISPVLLQERFSSYPNLLQLTNNCTLLPELHDFINKEFAFLSYEQEDSKPISRLKALAKVLPMYRKRVKSVFDPDSESMTDDPRRVTDIVHDYWKGKWSKKTVKHSSRFLKKYTKRIKVPPKRISAPRIEQLINGTNDSSAGPDGIPFLAYRLVANLVSTVFLGCIISLRNGDPPPHDFNGGLLYVLPKKDTGLTADTRPLVVNNTDNRIIAVVIRDSIEVSLDSILSDNQHGFRQKRSVDANINFYNEQFYSALEEDRNYDIIFLDISKAFDSVAHSFITDILIHVGFDIGTVNSITALFSQAFCLTTIDRSYSKRIDFYSGVKQGCPLSPSLFILVMDVLEYYLSLLTDSDVRLYADDTAIGDVDLTKKLYTIKRCFELFYDYTGLAINTDKTQVVSTYNQAALSLSLSSIGWDDVVVTGKAPYLGVSIGHLVTLQDLFSPAWSKFTGRLHNYTSIKLDLSLPKRVLVWNTWLLPIFSFLVKFYIIPSDYLHKIDIERDYWIDHRKRFTVRHLCRPRHLGGLAAPVRHTLHSNYASLVGNSDVDAPPLFHDNRSWSLRIRTHKQMVIDLLQSPSWNLSIAAGDPAPRVYSNLLSHSHSHGPYLNALKASASKCGVSGSSFGKYLHNFAQLPSWVPDYARFTNIAIIHNALPTAVRNHRKINGCYPPCPLCNRAADSAEHIFGGCSTARKACDLLSHFLHIPSPTFTQPSLFHYFTGSDSLLLPSHCATRFLFARSLWQASCNARNGGLRSSVGWAAWVVDDCFKRIAALNPTIFLSGDFPGNRIPTRFKIVTKLKLGNANSRSCEAASLGRTVVARSIAELPADSVFAFTDGASKGNPGPTGAGFALYLPSAPNTAITCAYASLGISTNQISELYAIGMAIEHCIAHNIKKQLYIWTDSATARGLLVKGWCSSSPTAQATLFTLMNNYRNFTGFDICVRKCPGHAGIPQNDRADELANIGAHVSKNLPHGRTNVFNTAYLQGFLSLATYTS
jgi:ribonuclease HI